jgi:hypothetical protein
MRLVDGRLEMTGVSAEWGEGRAVENIPPMTKIFLKKPMNAAVSWRCSTYGEQNDS